MAAQGAALDRGYRLGKYEVIGRISVGGMAELYLAVLAGQGGFKKFVALKRVLPAVAQQESFLKMFLDEARITASLSHANIAQVFELAEDPENSEPVLAMEFVAGQNVAQIIKRARERKIELPVGFSCRIIHDVLLGLHSAHHFVEPASGKPMPVIHRDINPRNLMVTYVGGTKIIDFGIAKARGRLDSTQVGMVKGTLQYMSPEQVMLKEVDGRSDLFAAAVVLYELLTGLRLFDEPSDAVLLSRIVKGDIPRLRDVMPTLAPELVDVVMRGLARLPEDRWRSGRDFARALDQAVPDLFDDEGVAELMGRLFEDKIAITRALLQSTSTDASYANLTLMTQGQDEPGSKPVRAPEPIVDVPTDPSRSKVDVASVAHPTPQKAAQAPTVNARPLAGGELPTQQAPRATAGSSADTLVMDEPVSGPQAAPAPAKAASTSFEDATTEPLRERMSSKAAGPAETVAEGGGRRPTGGVPAQGRKRTVEGPAAPRRPSSDGAVAAKKPPAAPPPEKPEPVGRRPTVERPATRKPTADAVAASPTVPPTAREPVLAPRSTSERQLLQPVAVSEVLRTGPGGLPRSTWLIVALVALVLLALAGALLLGGAGQPAPEDFRPLQGPGARPGR